MTAQVAIAAISCMVLASVAHAQPPAASTPQSASPQWQRYVDPASGLSLDAAIDLALKQEPSLRAARTAIDAAVARRQQAALRANPTATFERREEPAGTDNQTMLGVQLPLELFRRGARVNVAERDVTVSRLEVADRERRLAAEVRARYGDVLVAIRELSVLDELLSAVRQQLDIIAARVKEGATPPLERDLLDVEVRRLAADRRLQVGRVDATLVELRRIIGLSPDAPLTVRDTLEAVVVRESASAAESLPDAQTSIQNRADVRAAEARIAVADARIRQAQSEGRVDVSLFGTYMRMDAGFPQNAFGPHGGLERVRGVFKYVAGGAMVMIPVFNRNQGAVAAARAERAGAEAEREATLLQARSDVTAARIEDTAAHDAASQYRDGAQRLAQQNVTVVAETFQLGRATVFDVLSEQRRYLDVEKSFTDALRSAFEARTRLLLALGEVR
jgi:cobalt-zinc-cadmium efflux system outer membrane protein